MDVIKTALRPENLKDRADTDKVLKRNRKERRADKAFERRAAKAKVRENA